MRLVAAYGCQRLMWASDAPYQLTGAAAGLEAAAGTANHSYKASLALIRDPLMLPELTAEDREWLLWRTAEKVFFFR